LARGLSGFRTEDVSTRDELRWSWLVTHAAVQMWDDETWYQLANRHVRLAREWGALTILPVSLDSLIGVLTLAGELADAASLVDEVDALMDGPGSHFATYAGIAVAAWRGRESELAELTEAIAGDRTSRYAATGPSFTHRAKAVLDNGLGRYELALSAAESAVDYRYPYEGFRALPEIVEAASRIGAGESAARALEQLADLTRATGSDWGLGTEARSRALLNDGPDAERLYREAIERLGRTHARTELARAHLLYGEWLRRERRRAEARAQLGTAHAMFTSMGAEAFAARAARELAVTGETARKRTPETRDRLTPQEAQVAQLARQGLSNPEIGAQLFISPRTVQYHLHKVFSKLGVTSRAQLAAALSSRS